MPYVVWDAIRSMGWAYSLLLLCVSFFLCPVTDFLAAAQLIGVNFSKVVHPFVRCHPILVEIIIIIILCIPAIWGIVAISH